MSKRQWASPKTAIHYHTESHHRQAAAVVRNPSLTAECRIPPTSPAVPPPRASQNRPPREILQSYCAAALAQRRSERVRGGLREDDPSDDGDGQEHREELDRGGRHRPCPRPADPRHAARIRACDGAGMASLEP